MNFMFLAEGIDSIPAAWWKNFCLGIIALLFIAGIVVGIWATLRKPDSVKLKDDPAIEVRKAPKRYNHELTEGRFSDHERRLVGLETWRYNLLEKLEADKKEIIDAGDERKKDIEDKVDNRHAENATRINRLMVAVARLCGRQGIKMPDEGEEL